MSEKTSKAVDATIAVIEKTVEGAPAALDKTVEVAEHIVTEVVRTPKSTKFLIAGLAALAIAGTAGSVAYIVSKRKNKAEAEALDEDKASTTDEDLQAMIEAEQMKASGNGTKAKK